MAHQHKRIEGSFSQGWPLALFVTALAVGAFATAGMIHKRIFRSPNDVTAEYRKDSPAGEGHDTASAKTGH
jgi:hypothetical protein